MGREVISIKNLTFTYGEGKKPALKNINFNVREGEIVLITGPSGAGKTTLIRCINGLIPHFFRGIMEGDVIVDGVNTRETTVAYLSSKIGTVFQDPSELLISPTVEDEIAFGLENFGYPVDEIERRIEKYIKLARLEKHRNRNPHTLSGGEQQSCVLASVLAVEPNILLLDEPTSNLDPIGSRMFFNLFAQLAKEERKTIVIVEHKLEELLPVADRLVVLYDGEMILNGNPRHLLTDIKKMYKMGLKVPDVTLLFSELREKGLDVKEIPMTVEDAYNILIKILESKKIRLAKEGHTNIYEKENRKEAMPIGNRGEKAEHKPVIIVRDLWHVYLGGIEALKGVSLEIYPREFIVILGQNGSGKTTLVKHFNGLLKPTRGEVIVYGMDTKTVSIAELAKKVGYVFQNPDHQIFSKTVREEIAFGPKNLKLSEEEIDERVAEAARILKIEEYLDENPFNLSWGLRQRVAIASILSMKPEVLIVDEPTTGQDHKTGREIMEILCKLNKEGITIIVITHDMKLAAEYAQRAIVMKEGHILLDGNIRDVFSKIEVLKEAYLMPPQITQLSLKLRKYGVPTALRVEEFIQFLNDMGVI